MAGHDRRLDGRTGAGGAPAATIERSTAAAGARAARRHLGGRPRAGAAPSRRPAALAGGERRNGFLKIENKALTMGNVHLIDHPLVQHKLTLMRKKEASTNSF